MFRRQSKVRGVLYACLIGEISTGRKVMTSTDNDIQIMKRLIWTVVGGGKKAGNVLRKARIQRTKERAEKRRE